MRKTFILEDLDCAHCAAKMQNAISKLDGIKFVNISFITSKITLEIEDEVFEEKLKEVQKIIKKVEPDCNIVL